MPKTYKSETEFLTNYNIKNYPQPSLAADIVLLSLWRDKPDADKKTINIYGLDLLLINRANYPEKNKWALPGGFCKPAESVHETAKRELFEETHVADTYLSYHGVYSRPDRDPRGWIISNAFLALIDRNQCSLRADTDAWDAKWFGIEQLSSDIMESDKNSQKIRHTLMLADRMTDMRLMADTIETITFHPNRTDSIFKTLQSDLAFDHAEIITQAVLDYRRQILQDIRPVFSLLPEYFTLGELTESYRVSAGLKTIAAANFKRRIEHYVIPTELMSENKGFRPARLYKRNPYVFMTP